MTKRFALTPDLACPELEGYKLPEIESALQKARQILSDGISTNMSLSSAIAELDKLIREEDSRFIKFTLEDMVNAFKAGFNITGESFNRELIDYIPILQESYDEELDKFYQSLRTPRTPIAIEVEMGVEVDPNTGVEMGEYPDLHWDCTVKGVWVYE
jgi:hypothetical protein